jgi:hypothetical protein
VPNIHVGGCQTPAGEPLMQLVAVDWFKDSKRIDHVVRCKDCVAQVAAERGLFTLAFNVQVFNFCHFTIDTRCYKLFTV